ncbi:GntR family transcriptional regulator (plasmid) [Deinococcus taeanensis]|uniref:GntR family transcriptional regulator n=1 Tax=Deinococcus taeanensis TaxID=2737050 RepID=UPI001CDBEC30|nr:GntR family transcriptional regulator [Deinococcus taeanensis]UBV45061.1 GntR family transcriptional regulator [Deinococcus taeanensis]
MTRSGDVRAPLAFPRYLQVQQALQEMIEGTEYAPGDKVPSERELAEQLGVSRMTVRRAMDNLVRMGLLERDSTAGTRVSAPKVNRLLNDPQLHSITQMVTAEGGQAGGRLLEFQVTAAPSQVSERLGVPVGSAVVMLRRLRLVNEVPFCLETSYLPHARVPGLAAEDLMGNQSLYRVLRERYGIEAGVGESVISVAPATVAEGRALNLGADQSVLLYRTLVRDPAGVPFEYLKSANHPQFVVFRIGEGGRG